MPLIQFLAQNYLTLALSMVHQRGNDLALHLALVLYLKMHDLVVYGRRIASGKSLWCALPFPRQSAVLARFMLIVKENRESALYCKFWVACFTLDIPSRASVIMIWNWEGILPRSDWQEPQRFFCLPLHYGLWLGCRDYLGIFVSIQFPAFKVL